MARFAAILIAVMILGQSQLAFGRYEKELPEIPDSRSEAVNKYNSAVASGDSEAIKSTALEIRKLDVVAAIGPNSIRWNYDAANAMYRQMVSEFASAGGLGAAMNTVAARYERCGLRDKAMDVCREVMQMFPDSNDYGQALVQSKVMEIGNLVDAYKLEEADKSVAEIASSLEGRQAAQFLCEAARYFDDKKHYQYAFKYYELAENAGDADYAQKVKFQYEKAKIKNVIYNEPNGIGKALEMTEVFRKEYAESPDLFDGLMNIYTEYPWRGMMTGEPNYFRVSSEYLERDILGHEKATSTRSMVFYMLAYNANMLKDWPTVLEAASKMVEINPNHKWVWYGYELIATSSQELVKAGQLNEVEADPAIIAALCNAISTYPKIGYRCSLERLLNFMIKKKMFQDVAAYCNDFMASAGQDEQALKKLQESLAKSQQAIQTGVWPK